MNYLHAMTMLLSLVAIFLCLLLGVDYQTIGKGLHPVIAGLGILSAMLCGFYSATKLGSN
jgi:hypothetical protein